MKKTYINPTTEAIKIATMQMLAASTENVQFGEGQKGGGEAAGRGFYDLDDDF